MRELEKEATFVVRVLYQENATWQGTILWSEQGETQRFRSALELLKLIDDALEKSKKDVKEQAPDTEK